MYGRMAQLTVLNVIKLNPDFLDIFTRLGRHKVGFFKKKLQIFIFFVVLMELLKKLPVNFAEIHIFLILGMHSF